MSLRLLLVLLMLVLPAGPAAAIGLGELHLASRLNQPLAADIDIVDASHEDLARLSAAVANPETFLKFGLDRPAFLATLTFRVVDDGTGHPSLRVRSSEAFTEPFVDVLVNLSWPGGSLIRDYTLLLDPASDDAAATPATRAVASARLAPATAADAPGAPTPAVQRGESGRHRSGADASAAKPTRAEAPAANAAGEDPASSHDSGTYRVVVHDTLDGIVHRLGVRGPAARAALARQIYAANPAAFAGDEDHLLAGATLSLPESTQITATADTGTAHAAAADRSARQASRSRATGAFRAGATTPDAMQLQALINRVEALEAALTQANERQLREHAELLALRDRPAEASGAARGHSSAPPAATIVPAAPVVSPPAADRPSRPSAGDEAGTELPAYLTRASEVPARAKSAPRPEPAREPPASHGTGALGWIAVGATLLLLGVLGARVLARRRATRDALAALGHDRYDAPDQFTDEFTDDDTLASPPAAQGPVPEAEAARDAAVDPPEASQGGAAIEPVVTAAAEEDRRPAAAESAPSRPKVLEPQVKGGDPGSAVLRDPLEPDPPPGGAGADDATLELTQILRAAEEEVSPDLSILEPDLVSTHMELTSRRYTNASGVERRSNGTDALKDALQAAIAREPDRIDLRMKLLEVYYTASVCNSMAFFELASALSREREYLPAEAYARIVAMQRAIASGPARDTDDPVAEYG